MIKKAIYITAIAAMASCGTTRNKVNATTQADNLENGITSVTDTDDAVAASNSFWGKLLGEACREMGQENICLSPMSAQFAMAMVASGAEGKTKKEICNTMQLGDSANINSRRLLDDIATKTVWNEHGDVRIANSIWIKDGFDVKQEFIDTNKEFFDALVESAEFNQETVKRVNDWCNENTNGKIPTILDRFTESDRMLLINALYLKAAWSKPFKEENTTEQIFTTEKGEEIKAPTMMMRSNEPFYSDEMVSMVSKRLQGGYSMLFILPGEGVKCDEAAEYVAKDFDTLLKNMEVRNVTLSLPKFTTDFGMSLKPVLANLGIKRAFGNKAQFGGISDEALFISDVVQKTYINVNEKGTEAAAVTVAVAGALSMRPPKVEIITFDRPFIYAIIKDNGNHVMFAGKVGNPTK
ncbi:MAG: serpin family protein [Bacteroidaceae bacterium]|nr:serpin family protein [Bacteroidaceae bacterium]